MSSPLFTTAQIDLSQYGETVIATNLLASDLAAAGILTNPYVNTVHTYSDLMAFVPNLVRMSVLGQKAVLTQQIEKV